MYVGTTGARFVASRSTSAQSFAAASWSCACRTLACLILASNSREQKPDKLVEGSPVVEHEVMPKKLDAAG